MQIIAKNRKRTKYFFASQFSYLKKLPKREHIIPTNTKARMYLTVVRPIITYAVETRPQKQNESQEQAK